MSGAFDNKPEAIIGRLGEIAAAEAMRSDGASTIALCRIDTGGAPMLETGSVRKDRSVLPDLQVFNLKAIPGAIFVEIKTYAKPGENVNGGFLAHGIPVRLFDHYVANESKTGIPVYLAINELDSGELRISSVPLSQLWKDPCQCRGCRSGSAHISSGHGIREAQWYFDRDDLSIVFRHSDKTIKRLRDEHSRLIKRSTKRGHVLQRHVDNAPAPRPRLPPPGVVGYTRPDRGRVVIGVEPSLLNLLRVRVGDTVQCTLGELSFAGVVGANSNVVVERDLPVSREVRISRS